MRRQSRNPHDVTGGETAGSNGEINSDNLGHSSRRARCRKSSRRAAEFRRKRELWAANQLGANSNLKQIQHWDVLRLMGSRSLQGRSRVTDDMIERRVREDQMVRDREMEMSCLKDELDKRLQEDDSEPLGYIPLERGDGVFRLLSVQLNGMSTEKSQNDKAVKLQYLIRKYDVQIIGMAEVGVNWSMARHGKRLLTLLPDVEKSARCTTSHNLHGNERHGIRQQGGVGLVAIGDVIAYYKKGNKDFRNLGRWDSFILSAEQHHRTRVVHAYGVRSERSEKIGSVYQQHVRYMQEHGIVGIRPRQLFEDDFLNQLRVWRRNGDRIILMMDANENVLTGRMCRELPKEGIELREATKDVLGELCPHTHPAGSMPIDGVWTTPDITVTNVKWLPLLNSAHTLITMIRT